MISLVGPLVLSLLLISIASTRLVFAGRWLNPITALFIPHILLLLSYQLALDGGMIILELSDSAWWALVGGYACYAIGVAAAAATDPQRATKKRKPFELAEFDRFQKTTIFLLAVLLLSVLSKYYQILTTYGNPIANIIQIRKDYVNDVLSFGLANSISFFSSFLLMMNLGVILGLRKPRVKGLLVATITLVMLNDFSTGSAYWTFLALCMLFISRYVTAMVSAQPGIRKRKPASAMSLLIIPLAMGLLLFLRSEGKYGVEVSFYELFTTYMGGNIASFGYFLDNPFPSVPSGRHVFGGAYGLLNGVLSMFGTSILPPNESADYWADIGLPWNTSIHFAYYFADFGGLGMLVSSAALGFIVSFACGCLLRKPGLLRIQYCVIALYMVVVSIRNVPTEGQYFWLLLLVVPLMNAYNRSRHRQDCRARVRASRNPPPPALGSSVPTAV
jgi:oligosaccharide repeat unit polymerase